MDKTPSQTWTITQAEKNYNLDGWGLGYFSINDKGNLCMNPSGRGGPTIDIMDIVDDIREKALGFPCVVRFQDILRARVAAINQLFNKAIEEHNYQGKYFGVYPIKVNQMREVVEEILDAGLPHHHGLEAGSKAELATVLGVINDTESLVVCNGYKDEEYLRLAMLGRKLGIQIIVVIEQFQELERLLRIAAEMEMDPVIGIRAKLTAKGTGKWEDSGGDFAKFGLTIPEIIKVVQILKEQGKTHILKLFHFHVGSQLTDIRAVKEAVTEATRVYGKLAKMGFDIEYLDVGGGLGVDYDGSRTTADSSINYSMNEYASDVVYNIQQICVDEGVKQPNIVSESGRALVAHHSCIIMDVFGNIEYGTENGHLKSSNGDIAKEWQDMMENLKAENALETYHDAVAKKQEALDMFRLGYLELEDRAITENYFWRTCKAVINLVGKMEKVPKEIKKLQESLVDHYYANFSLFQSAPDHWAIKQVFPLMPLHRLNEIPTRRTQIADLTCDSDGKVEKFIDRSKIRDNLFLHQYDGSPYYIGMFLMGAYQDIMGDMHNLFGRVNEIHVFCDDEDPEDFYIEEVIKGDSVSDVISRMQYAGTDLLKKVKGGVERRVREGIIKPKEGVNLVEFYQQILQGYTYLKSQN